MSPSFFRQLREASRLWWREQVAERGVVAAAFLLLRNLWSFVRDSTPEQRRRRFGDMEYDWEHRVDTTSGTVGWRTRLLGLFLSPYQPTDATLFREMMAGLPIEFESFTFVDLGCGKGRTLLMASEYPFRKIVGVEIVAELHRAAVENISAYRSASQRCREIEAVCMDAGEFVFPAGPLLIYLFNPLPEAGMRRVLRRLEESLARERRAAYLVYHNAELGHLISKSALLIKMCETEQYSIYCAEKSD